MAEGQALKGGGLEGRYEVCIEGKGAVTCQARISVVKIAHMTQSRDRDPRKVALFGRERMTRKEGRGTDTFGLGSQP